MYSARKKRMSSSSLFKNLIDINKQSRAFKHLSYNENYVSARLLLDNIFNDFKYLLPSEQAFIRNFQGKNFNGHLFEIYLFSVLKHLSPIVKVEVDRINNSPDFLLKYPNNEELFIEATSLNPPDYDDNRSELLESQFYNLLINNPDKLASSIRKDIPKKYLRSFHKKLSNLYELQHVKNRPLIVAIQDYHSDASILYSMHTLIRCLYQVENVEEFKPFYNDNDAKEISAILFTNQATISKFLRMSKLLGYDKDRNTTIYRFGVKEILNDKGELIYEDFRIDLDDNDYSEDWFEGIWMFHNPHALHPIEFDRLSPVNHFYLDRFSHKVKQKCRPIQVEWSCTHVSDGR